MKLFECTNAEEIIAPAIEDIDKGSIQTVNFFISQRLKKPRYRFNGEGNELCVREESWLFVQQIL